MSKNINDAEAIAILTEMASLEEGLRDAGFDDLADAVAQFSEEGILTLEEKDQQ